MLGVSLVDGGRNECCSRSVVPGYARQLDRGVVVFNASSWVLIQCTYPCSICSTDVAKIPDSASKKKASPIN